MSRQFTNEQLKLMDISPAVLRQQVSYPIARKIDLAASKVRISIPNMYTEPDFIEKLKGFIQEALLTEEATDALIDIIAAQVPWGLGWAVKRILDSLLPEKVLFALFMFLDKLTD